MKYYKYIHDFVFQHTQATDDVTDTCGGAIKKMECTEHAYSWSGRVPCTGILRCIFCGRDKHDLKISLDVMTDERNYCPECGCHWFVHNDDGSCVEDL